MRNNLNKFHCSIAPAPAPRIGSAVTGSLVRSSHRISFNDDAHDDDDDRDDAAGPVPVVVDNAVDRNQPGLLALTLVGNDDANFGPRPPAPAPVCCSAPSFGAPFSAVIIRSSMVSLPGLDSPP